MERNTGRSSFLKNHEGNAEEENNGYVVFNEISPRSVGKCRGFWTDM
jgi:hypothetical protein